MKLSGEPEELDERYSRISWDKGKIEESLHDIFLKTRSPREPQMK